MSDKTLARFKWTGIGLGILSLVLFLVFEFTKSDRVLLLGSKNDTADLGCSVPIIDNPVDMFCGWGKPRQYHAGRAPFKDQKDVYKITASLLLFVITVVAGLLVFVTVFFKHKGKVVKGLSFTLSVLVVVLVALESFSVHKLYNEKRMRFMETYMKKRANFANKSH